MRYDLAAMARRVRNVRRSSIVLRDIAPPALFATNLYRSTYAHVIAAWTDALPRINAAYERTLDQITRDAYPNYEADAVLESGLRVSSNKIGGARLLDGTPPAVGPNPTSVRFTDAPADVRAEIDGAAEQVNRLLLLLTPNLRDWALRVEKWQRGKWRGAVLSATGVDLETMVGAGDMRATLETTIEWNTALISDVSAVTQQRIATAVYDGLRNRTPARDVAKNIRGSVDMSRDRSVRIASDQLNKLTSSLADERRREAGIDTWLWRSSHKLHYRPEHAARDGKEYTDADAPQDRPGQLPYCGCRSQAVVKFD